MRPLRGACGVLALSLAGAPVAAQVAASAAAQVVDAEAAAAGMVPEGGPIRGGEHDGFTRLVLQVDPKTEWSLETGGGRAVVRFPGKPLDFATGGAFDRIPRSRVRSVTANRGRVTTEIVVELGCDCRVTASFVGARYLALDIIDPGAAGPAASVAGGTAPAAAATGTEDPQAREARESTAVRSAEELLVAQIERAAGQGLVQLTLVPAAAAGGAAGSPAAPEPLARPAGTPAPAAATTPPERPMQPLSNGLAALAEEEQIEATSVYDRDDGLAIARRALARRPSACLPDAALAVADWARPTPWPGQLAELRSHLVGEFDRPSAEGIRALARFYIRTGFGAEARALLAGFPAVEALPDRALLLDLAAVADGGTASPDGPLALADPCPGRHALWLALGGVAPAFREAAGFVPAETAFGELPPDMRLRFGPHLVGRLIDEGRPGEARRVLEATLRSGLSPTPALQLAQARTFAAEGDAASALRAFAALTAGRDAVALDALAAAVRLAVEHGLPVPDRVLTDLRGAALEHRGTPREVELRTLLVEALADRAELPAAVREARAAARDLPDAAGRFEALTLQSLAAADPAAVPPGTYVETVLGAADVIASAPGDDPARRTIAGRLVDLGLPTPALRVVDPAIAAGDRGARLVGARARLELGDPAAARAALAGLNGPGSAAIRAQAFALDGNYGRALALAEARGLGGAATYAWPAGAWTRVEAGPEAPPERPALAAYMGGEAPPPSPDPASLPPAEAFREPLPDLSRPSLDAARRLLAAGPGVGGLVADALADNR